MRILYVLSESPLNAHAGIATYVKHAFSAQVAAGHDVHLLTWKFVEDQQAPFPHDLPVPLENIHLLEVEANAVWRAFPSGPWRIGLSHYLADTVEETVRLLRPDVIETSEYDAPLYAYLLRREAGRTADIASIPVICYNHGLLRPIYAHDFNMPSDSARLEMAAEREVLRLADLVLVPSSAAGEFIRQECGTLTNLASLPEPFVSNRASTHSHLNRFISLGRMSISKGLDSSIHFLNFVDAVDPIEEIIFIGRPGFIQFKIHDAVEYTRKRLSPRLRELAHFVGEVPHHDVPNLVRGGGFGLAFSRQETFNYSFLELTDAGILPFTRAGTAMAEFFPPHLRHLLLPFNFDLRFAGPTIEAYRSRGVSIHKDLTEFAFSRSDPARFAERYRQLVEDLKSRLSLPRRQGSFIGRDVTVLMASFNSRQFIREAVESVANQTISVAELVIVDDGSDNAESLMLLEALAVEPNVRVIRSDANEGLTATRLKLVDSATTKLSVFLDDDDKLEPSFVEECLLAINFSGADAAIPWRQNFGINDAIATAWHMNDYEYLFTNDHRMTGVLKTDVLRNIGFSPMMRNGEADDWDFWLRFKEAGNTAVSVPAPLFRYRYYEGSMSWPWSSGQMVGTSQDLASRIIGMVDKDMVPDSFFRELVCGYFSGRYYQSGGASSHSREDEIYIDRGRAIAALRLKRPLIGKIMSVLYRVVTSVARRLPQ